MASKAQKPWLAPLHCYECGIDIATVQEASVHFKNQSDKQHTKAFKEKLFTNPKHSQAVYYYGLPNLMFKCFCMPGHYFETKASLRAHLESLDMIDIICAH
jgi:hypothetical protein